MKHALGVTEAVWQGLCLPQLSTHDLDTNTPVYLDGYVALEVFGMRYPDYVRQVPRTERLFYQLLLALKGAKETRAQERAQREAEAERVATEAITPTSARR